MTILFLTRKERPRIKGKHKPGAMIAKIGFEVQALSQEVMENLM
jgi:hypothetical protein